MSHRNKRRTNRTPVNPAVEGMEPRLLMANSGAKWSKPALITYSIAPDGTDIGGTPSNLQSTLNARFSTATWQAQFQKAAAIWQAVANINLAQVSDSGAAFGTNGNQQGDSRFGDIRIGGLKGNTSTLASAFMPPPYNGGTLAGDIVVNTAQSWQINNDYDLLTVAIHEFGHSLGLDHSQIAAADMYASYNGMKQSLASDDTSSIQGIYGQRTSDTDNAAQNATAVTLDGSGVGTARDTGLATSSDADWFKVTAPANSSGTLRVSIQASGLSSLAPKLLVYNSSMQGVGSAASSAYGATVTASISGATSGQTYYIKAVAGAGGAAGTGAFGVVVNFGSGASPTIGSPVTPVASTSDKGGGSAGESAGSGGLLGGGGLLGVNGVLSGLLEHLGLEKLQIGTLIGWGDDMKVTKGAAHPTRRANKQDGASDSDKIALPITAAVPRHQAHRRNGHGHSQHAHKHAAFGRVLRSRGQ